MPWASKVGVTPFLRWSSERPIRYSCDGLQGPVVELLEIMAAPVKMGALVVVVDGTPDRLLEQETRHLLVRHKEIMVD